ncbi:hypothetical protein [Wenxinia saemankumensis]|uniref:Uncharacterized protein n=1 Tax=Wenxinia saemankumensis TaxID=1447782 RepID=A0A1M6E7Y1_9RHOB|nr:hypothetical protein [Wenxinia saemankumensis]SHI81545.1 hypothetical protein SAMN05444417_1858 [Wenxinia saemankumensis]
MRALILAAGLAALGCFLVLVWVTVTGLMPDAGGLRPFDLRPLGYDLATATAYLQALSEEGRATFRTTLATWDTAFPVALTAFLALLCLRRGGRLGWLGALVALVYGGVDLAENAAVLRLVEGPVPPDPLTVTGASVLTMAKFAALLLACLIYLLARGTRR